MDYLLTGSTGLIGRHILIELLKQIMDQGLESRIFLTVRPRDRVLPQARIIRLLQDAELPAYIQGYDLNVLLKHIVFIEHNLNCKNLIPELKNIPSRELIVIHNAASTNLMPGRAAEKDIKINNHDASKHFIQNLCKDKLKKIVYISTAFSCGIQPSHSLIPLDYSGLKITQFRNPYEENKHHIEEFLNGYCSENNIALQILRPAVVSGRLMDQPLYCTTKFDVFYGWAKFFYKMKQYFNDTVFRLFVNKKGHMNILPVDFVAKVISEAIMDDAVKHLNIVNPAPHLHTEYISKIFERVGIKHFEFTDVLPARLSKLEKFYLQTAGKAFSPYISTEDQTFDTTLLQQKYKHLNYDNNIETFGRLIDYAISKGFEISSAI